MPYSPTRRQLLQCFGAGLVAACTVRPASSDPAAGWRDGLSLPFPVQEIYPTLHHGRIHLAGGFVSENGEITGPTAAHHALDPETGIWAPRAPLPVPRHHPQLVSFKGSLYSIGGFEARENGAWQMQGDMWRYDEAKDAWERAPELPVPNAESVAGVVGDMLILAGGRLPKADRNLDWNDQSDTANTWIFDGHDWTEAAPMPTARNSAAAGVIDGKLYVAGGRTVEGGNVPAFEAYDPATDRWETHAPMPQAQAGLAAGVVDGKLYVFGGEYFENGGGVFPEAWAYDPTADSWQPIADMPTARHGLGGVTLGRAIYLIGGAKQRGGNETSAAVEIYTP